VVKVIDFKPLALSQLLVRIATGTFILSCEEAIQLAYGTLEVLLRCSFVPEIMHGMALEVFLY
jgi:hypothetical protein